MNTKLSFIIPAYNEGDYIGKCLKSVLREKNSVNNNGIEIIVVNNASTDKTKEKALAFPGVKVIDKLEKGLVGARHAGYEVAAGELIANVDADDIMPAGWLKKALTEFSQNDKLVALSGPIVWHNESFIVHLLTKIFYLVSYAIYSFRHFVLRKNGLLLQGGNCVIKKSALDLISGYDMKINFYGEDTHLARRLQKLGQIKFTFDFPMYSSSRRLRNEGVTTVAFRYVINHFWVLALGKSFTKHYKDIR